MGMFQQSLTMVLALVCSIGASAQESLLTRTLNFRDVSDGAVNTKFPDTMDNEKKIDFADYDNDGDLDVAISGCLGDFGQRRNKLYRNDNGVLNEVSGSPVIPAFDIDDMSRACLFRDFNNDGFADIVVVCDSNSGTNGDSAPGRTKFLRNVNGETFVNETSRLDNLGGSAGDGVAADFDQNGLLDIVLTNHPNLSQDTMVLNGINDVGAGNFVEVTNTNMLMENEYGAQIEAADMNGDGLIDLLVANVLFNDDAIYFNNNNNEGSGPGDFRYDGENDSFVIALPHSNNVREQQLLPADFDNDGRVDFLYTNAGVGASALSPRADQIWKNKGNNQFNVPEFESSDLAEDTLAQSTRADVADLDGDGRQDIIVVARDRRPYIFRNTSENDEISFVAWTPVAFSEQQIGWAVGIANLVGDEQPDVLVGARRDEFLMEAVPAPTLVADELNDGQLPELLDQDPLQIVGEAGYGGTVFNAGTLPPNTRVSILLRSFGDLTLNAVSNNMPRVSDRPGHATDEALQFVHSGGELEIEVFLVSPSFDGNGDGLVNLLDVPAFIDCVTGISSDCEPFDTDDDGMITLLDVSKFIERLNGSPVEEAYSLEVLIRSD